MKIVTVVGARPQFIKAAVVSRIIKESNLSIHEKIIHTGQHFDNNMSRVFFDELDIPLPVYNLGIGGGSHGQNTGRMIEGIENVLKSEKPDWLIVYGDTDSTLAGALSAAKLHIPVAHVEAGLRSFNRRMPEEINRILTDNVSTLLFTPTNTASLNLKKEGFTDASIRQVGDVMLDAALFYKNYSKKPHSVHYNSEFILATIHRSENTDDFKRLTSILQALKEIAQTNTVVLPLHPRTRKKLKDYNIDTNGINIIDPVSYLEMIWLLEGCKMVVTDSGGLQKEAYYFGKVSLITRDETEWNELVDSGWNILVGADNLKIVNAFFDKKVVAPEKINFYGDGSAGKAIVSTLFAY